MEISRFTEIIANSSLSLAWQADLLNLYLDTQGLLIKISFIFYYNYILG